jgi:hypothetical protein
MTRVYTYLPFSWLWVPGGTLIVCVCIITISSEAEARELSLKAQKVVQALEHLDIQSKTITEVVDYVDASVKKGYVALAQDEVAGGTLKMGYDLGSGFHPGDVQLRYTPEDSNTSYTASRTGVLASYQLHF